MDREDYDPAKALKGELEDLRSVADAGIPLETLTTVPLSQILNEDPVSGAVPTGKTFPLPEHCRASVQDLKSGNARKEPVILPCALPYINFPTFTKACQNVSIWPSSLLLIRD